MNRKISDIARAIHKNNKGSILLPSSQETTRLIIVEACRTIIDMLKAGDTVFVGELGTFSTKWTPERTITHPRTGEVYTIPAHYKPCFTMVKRIKEEIGMLPYMGKADDTTEIEDEKEEVT